MTRTHYALCAMSHGELMNGMYSRSNAAESPEIARQLARPKVIGQTDTALCRVETVDDSMRGEPTRRQLSCVILEILPPQG